MNMITFNLSIFAVPARAPLRGERVGRGAGVDRVFDAGGLLVHLHRPLHEAVPPEAARHLARPHDRAADVRRQRSHLLQRAGIRNGDTYQHTSTVCTKCHELIML